MKKQENWINSKMIEMKQLQHDLEEAKPLQSKSPRIKEMIITKRPKLDTFSGIGEEDVRAWISAFKARMDLASWDEDQAKEELVFHLKGKALTWIHREHLVNNTLDLILQKMEDTFEPRNRSVTYALINELKQDPKETVESYTQRFEMEAKDIYGPQEQMSKALSYVKGLRKDLYFKVSQMEPTDFNVAVKLAKIQEKKVSARDAYDKKPTTRPGILRKTKEEPVSGKSEKKIQFIKRDDETELELAVKKILEDQIPKIVETTVKGMQEKVKNINQNSNKPKQNNIQERKEKPTYEYCSRKGHLAVHYYKKKREDKKKEEETQTKKEAETKVNTEDSVKTKN